MATENGKHRQKMGLLVQGRSEEVDRLIEETERAMLYTRRFLAQIGKSQERSKEYIKRYEQSLEFRLERLHDARERLANEENDGKW